MLILNLNNSMNHFLPLHPIIPIDPVFGNGHEDKKCRVHLRSREQISARIFNPRDVASIDVEDAL